MSDHLGRLESGGTADNYRQTHLYSQDIAALCAECRRLRAGVAELEGVLSDVREDGPFRAGEAHGAARQLAEVMSVLDRDRPYTTAEALVEYAAVRGEIEALGPVRPPLPEERVAEENEKLRAALLDLLPRLSAFLLEGIGVPGNHEAVNAARALLGLPPLEVAAAPPAFAEAPLQGRPSDLTARLLDENGGPAAEFPLLWQNLPPGAPTPPPTGEALIATLPRPGLATPTSPRLAGRYHFAGPFVCERAEAFNATGHVVYRGFVGRDPARRPLHFYATDTLNYAITDAELGPAWGD